MKIRTSDVKCSVSGGDARMKIVPGEVDVGYDADGVPSIMTQTSIYRLSYRECLRIAAWLDIAASKLREQP